jgi:DUF917 family protein
MRYLTMTDVELAVAGGSLLAGGGGGWVEHGRTLGRLAIERGPPAFAGIDEVAQDGALVTASLVGANSSPTAYLEPEHYIRAAQLLSDRYDGQIAGFISSENGSSTTLNGWLQASAFNLPVVDAPCNGRAHPTGKMGSLGLGSGYHALQVAVGGDPTTGSYVEVVASGTIETAANVIRAAAVQAGGVVAVARNPVSVAECRERAAVGGISFALELGRRVTDARSERGGRATVEAAAEFLKGEDIGEGRVVAVKRETVGGFDIGTVRISDRGGSDIDISGYMEYVVVEVDGRRAATFPDLIVLFEAESGDVVSFAEIGEGREVIVFTASKEGLLLGAGVRVPEFYAELERATGKDLVSYVFE